VDPLVFVPPQKRADASPEEAAAARAAAEAATKIQANKQVRGLLLPGVLQAVVADILQEE
jgi:hypothetical protein